MPETPPPDRGDLDTLLARLVDETISPEEWRELERRLEGDPGAQRRYLRYLDLHAELAQAGRCGGTATGATRFFGLARGRVSAAAGLAAAAVMVVAAVSLIKGNGAPEAVVRVVDLDGPVRWAGGEGEVEIGPLAGRSLPAGTLELLTPDSGAELAFPDGTALSLTGRSAITVRVADGRKVLRLREGNLSIDAAEQPAGKPLRVITPSAEAEVLGTQFNVRADAYSARFVVNEGRVRVRRLADGRVEEVAADEVVVASLEQGTEFAARPRREFVESWKSVLPRDRLQGQWEPATGGGEGGAGGLRATPHLWTGEPDDPERPILLFTAVLDPSAGSLPPLRLTAGARLRVTGRIEAARQVHLGFATNHPHGGFSGKYAVRGGVAVEPGEGGRFAFERGIEAFTRTRERFPGSPENHEVVYFWIQTVEANAGLVVEAVELER